MAHEYLVRVQRILVALVVFVAAVIAWIWLVDGVGIWWTLRHPPAPVPGTDTYFLMSSRVVWLTVLMPLVLFSIWFWRRVLSRGG